MNYHNSIIIHKKDHSTVTIECNDTIMKELYHYFSVYSSNYMFAPLYKSKMWDGKIHFFKLSTNELPIGLVYKVYEFAEKGNYKVKCKYDVFNKITKEEFQKFVNSLNLPEHIQLRPYQFDAAFEAIRMKNMNCLISTAGGKSLVIYVICRFMMIFKKKVLLICSRTGLVEQMFKDFQDYNFDSERYCHRIYGGQRKFYDAPIIISTWQSLISPKVKQDNPYHDFECLICDEVHEAAKDTGAIQNLAKYCVNAEYRYGFSGTYPESVYADWYSIVGSFGKIVEFATYKYLQENNYIAQIKVYPVILEYDTQFRYDMYNTVAKEYGAQNDMLYQHEGRNKFLVELTDSLSGNTLILFTKKAKHGYILLEYFKNKFGDRVVYVDGDTPLEDREDVRTLLETRNDIILLATYGTLSAGWNVKNLMNLILASGYKSRIKTLQSIGRTLRLHKNKDFARLFDIVDNACFVNKAEDIRFINYAYDHYGIRHSYYTKENWNLTVKKYNI